MVKRRLDFRSLISLLLLLSLPWSGPGQAQENGGAETADSLDARYQRLAARYQQSLRGETGIFDDPAELVQQIRITAELRHPQQAIRLLLANLDSLISRAQPSMAAEVSMI